MPNKTYRLNRAELARFHRQVTIQDCWTWNGPTTTNGYGKWQKASGHKDRAIHRIIWEHHHNQPIPAGMQLDHLCRNRLCCNPAHLEVVTPSENTKRQDHANRNKTHCPKGHQYTPQTTRITPSGKRVCKQCDRERKTTHKPSK